MSKLQYLVITLLVLCGFFFSGKTPVLAAPPPNFQTEQVIGSGLNGPSGFEIAPDGRIFILQRTGEIKIYKNGQLLPNNFAVLPSIASGDRGLIGIAFDPDFGITNHWVYFYYTGLDKLNRLVRYDASEDIGQDGPYVLYQTTSPSQELHVGGSIRFGPDGKLYFAVGDNGYPPNAQDLSNPHGKILRINKDGSIPIDNPFVGVPGALPEIWAYGFRNPWRFQFDPATGELYGGDVGDFTWEEVNHIMKGKNYGWPAAEGLCTSACPYIDPIYAYNHNGNSNAVTGGPVYHGTMFPAEYQGQYFFGDYAAGFIKTMKLDQFGNNLGVSDFDLNAGSVVDLKVAPDGSLYYITYFPGRLYRVTYDAGNHAPTANATADVVKGIEPLTVHFSSAGSSDPDNDPITYLWDFGDGTTSTEANPTKTYANKGTYTVELKVSDGQHEANAVPVVVQVGIPPTVTIGEPTDGSTYKAGDTIHYTAAALDGAGFDLNDSHISTEVIFHHHTHIHPFLGPIIGRQGTFTIPTIGEASADTWYEIKVTATDDNNLSTTKSVFIYPLKSNITLATDPEGLTVNLDGVPRTTPTTFEGVVNFQRELSAPEMQMLNGKVYQFDHWSDGLPQKHTIATQPTDTTYTAVYKESPGFQAEYFSNPTLSGTPTITRIDSEINFDWEDGSPDPQIPTNAFSARWTKTQYFNSGTFRFTATVDDGVRVYVDDDLLIDHWNNAGAYVADKTLTAGDHTIRMEYNEQFGGAFAKLEYDLAPTQQPAPDGYQAQFFNNKDLSGTPSLLRVDQAINYIWDNTSPDPTINPADFSARWTKNITLPAGIYTFTARADDGVRVKVDGDVVIDQWQDQATTTYTAQKNLLAGNHTIVVEYYQHTGGAVMIFDYQKTAELPQDGWDAEYFANKTLTGTPVLTRQDTAINFVWDNDSPDPVVPTDNFSARWTKTDHFTAGTYEFAATADDGVRVYVDNDLIIDQWKDQGATTYKVQKTLAEGDHTIVMEYYEASGGAIAKLSYGPVSSPPPPLDSYTGEYFNNMTLTAPVTMTRQDADINFDWDASSPDPLINANIFSVRWTKTVTLDQGTYQFSATADDGIRVKVDGETLIDQWEDQGATTYIAQKFLDAGQHTFVIEYYEDNGGAIAKFNYTKIANESDLVYHAQYWNYTGDAIPVIPTTAPDLMRDDSDINFDWDQGSPDPAITSDKFIAQWKRNYVFEDGTYTFSITSDDGARIYIDNQLILDQWNDHGATTYTVDKQMTAGMHEIKVEYYENTGGAVAKFSFQKDVPPPTDTFRGEYFDNQTLSGTPKLTRNDQAIDFNWDQGSPDPVIPNNYFSVRWTKLQQFAPGTYTFTTTSDDGVRLYIDGNLVIDQWHGQATTDYTADVSLTEGQHEIKLEYFEGTGGAVVKFGFTPSQETVQVNQDNDAVVPQNDPSSDEVVVQSDNINSDGGTLSDNPVGDENTATVTPTDTSEETSVTTGDATQSATVSQ